MTLFIFIILLTIVAPIQPLCTPSDLSNHYLEINNVIKSTGIKDDTKSDAQQLLEKRAVNEKQSRRAFSEKIFQICPKVSRTRLWKSKNSEPVLIGQGAYGSVFSVNLGGEANAVKQINLRRLLEKHLTSALNKKTSESKTCITSILASDKILKKSVEAMFFFQSQSTIDNSFTPEGEFIVGFTTPPPFDFSALTGCENILDVTAIVYATIKDTLGMIRQEIDISKTLSEYSLANESMSYPSFSKFHSCIVDQNFNIFLVVKKLGPTLGQVRSACPVSLASSDLHKRLLFAMRLLYQILKLHSMGYMHCDLKLDNLMFSDEDLDNFHIIDFGLASYRNLCLGGTAGFLPWEYLYKNIEETNRDEKFETFLYEKHDVFSSGMILFSWEFNFTSWMNLLSETSQLKGQHVNMKVKNSSIQASVQSALNEEYSKRYGVSYQASTDLKVLIDKEYSKILKQAILLDPNERLPVKVILYYVYTLYVSLENNSFEPLKLEALMKTPEKIMELIADDQWLDRISKLLKIKKTIILV